jgi:hypothetical protein
MPASSWRWRAGGGVLRSTEPCFRPFGGAFQFPELDLAVHAPAVKARPVELDPLAAVTRLLAQVLEPIRLFVPHGRPLRRAA